MLQAAKYGVFLHIIVVVGQTSSVTSSVASSVASWLTNDWGARAEAAERGDHVIMPQ